MLIRQLEMIRRLTPRMSEAARIALAEQADAIRETATGLVAQDRRDVDVAYHRAREARLGGVPPREFSMIKADERVPLA